MLSVAAVVCDVAAKRPQILFGVGQVALIVILCSRPLVVEIACRARALTALEMKRIRQGWA